MNLKINKMKTHTIKSIATILAASLLSNFATAESNTSLVIDDFSNANLSSLKTEWTVVEDSMMGGRSNSEKSVTGGKLTVRGEINPPRGMPGWVSLALPIATNWSPQDLSQHEGVRIKLMLTKGIISFQAITPDVKNYDYHATVIDTVSDSFQVIDIPFSEMKQSFSGPTKLNTEAIVNLSIVAIGMEKGEFAYAVDKLSYY